MPAADITTVSITFGFGVKREEFGPIKKAEATISASVPEGHDGVAALNYVSKIARDKVGELLGLSVPPVADTGRGSQLPAATEDTPDAGETTPPKRHRRTAAQIAADNAAAQTDLPPDASTVEDAGEKPAAEVAEPASDAGTATEAGASGTGSDTSGDEWDTPASAAPITDAQLLEATSATAGRIGKREPILALKETYRDLEKFPADQKFGVTDIPPGFRQDYLNKLAALTAG